MADTLFERLRQADTNSQQRALGSRIFGEAADLIAALERHLAEARAEIERERESHEKTQAASHEWIRRAMAAEADNARLREALTKIAGDVDGTWDEKFRAVQSIARAALEGKE